jgi:hypothetical protein
MIRYRLDDLGWFQFENLVQSLLKAELGLGVESWGGHGDYGRDAFCPESLNFPSKHESSPGPFVFQVKFVTEANAAGAVSAPALLAAVRKEMQRVVERRVRNSPKTSHYVLVTNAPVPPELRGKITKLVGDTLTGSSIHCLSGSDVCDMLDAHPNLRRAFPQLLSIRDLDGLIEQAVSRENIERSRAAIAAARGFVPIFVPTAAYMKAWKSLNANHFTVLEGPPEVGKTAIAWMIALTQLSLGWEAIVCDDPADLFERYARDRKQVFVADDAFGRTEYDPSRGSKWEHQLSRVYRELDGSHWLIWASRRLILERAKKAIDLQGEAEGFPKPGEVLVDATQLSWEEKALMLYRHARAAGLEEQAKNILRGHVRSVLRDPDFTPERIRRFVAEYLPELARESQTYSLTDEDIDARIRESIRNATERITKSYSKLPSPHKWVLISLLESSRTPTAGIVKKAFETRCPLELREDNSFPEILDELTEAFVKQVDRPGKPDQQIDWIHPSYRDVVIDHLAASPNLQLAFLEKSELPGIKLALSEGGGAQGNRSFALLAAAGAWEALKGRCRAIVEGDLGQNVVELLETLRHAALTAPDAKSKKEILACLGDVLPRIRSGWDAQGKELNPYFLGTYCRASALIVPLPPLPNLLPSWEARRSDFLETLRNNESEYFLFAEAVSDLANLLEIVHENEPRFLNQIDFPDAYDDEIVQLTRLARTAIEVEVDLDSADEYNAESSTVGSMAAALLKLSLLVPDHEGELRELAKQLTSKSSTYRGTAERIESEMGDADMNEGMEDSEYRERHSPNVLDVDELFSDL